MKASESKLLNCFVVFAKLYKRPINSENILDGIVLNRELDNTKLFTLSNKGLDELFSKVSSNIGFDATLVKLSKIKKIPKVVLPVILLLKDDSVCILKEFSKDGSSLKIIYPELNEKLTTIDYKKLQNEFTGSFFLLKPTFEIHDSNEKKLKKEKHWFWSSLSYSKSIYFDVIIASLLLNVFMLATPIFTMNIYDRVVPNAAFDTLWVFSIAIGIIYIFDTLMKYLRTYTLEVAAKKSDVIISSRLFEYVLRIKLFNRFESVGSFSSNLREFDHIRSFFTSSSMAALIDIPFLVIFLGVIFIIGGEIVIVPIVAAFIMIIYSLIIKRPLQKSIEKVSKSSAYKNSVLIESLSAIETIKSFNLQTQMQWRWEESVGKIAKDEIGSRLLSSSITTFSSFVIQVSSVMIIILGVYAISEQNLSMGGLIALVMLSSRTLAPLNQFASLISNYEYAKSSYKMLNDIMKLPTDFSNEQRFVNRKSIEGSIEFKNVKFKYPNSSTYILNDVSFKISSGEKVGIIGANGSGKTTILKLLVGLYEPESGSILIDGIDIHQVNPYDLRRYIAYVPQEIVLFKGTLQENIMNATENLTDEELIEAARLSAVEEFISQHPQGYNMPIQEQGSGLSGGQKQAIGVMRAFTKSKASMVLMDEPTNSMDSVTELKVESSLESFSKHKTMLIVSHKQSLLKCSQRLILLQNGKVLLDGVYENVLNELSKKAVK